MPHVQSVTGLEAVLAKPRAALQVPFPVQGVTQPMLLEMHFGKALYPEDGDDWTSILWAADGDLLLRRSRASERPSEGTASHPPSEMLGCGWIHTRYHRSFGSRLQL
jgi:hypothetical protein